VDGGAVTALAAARAAGLEVRAEPGRLVVRGPRRAEPLVQQLLARTGDVLALLAAEDAAVAWRAEVMRRQVPRRGPIPVLVAREVAPAPGCCPSCGEPLEEGRSLRCGACSRAAWLVLHEVRESVGQ
jgi:hypothetical protein